MVTNKRLLINSLIITSIIFLIGMFVGYQFDNLRTNDVVENLRQSELDAQSYLTEQDFFENFGAYQCELAQPRLIDLSSRLGELGSNLVNYEKRSVFRQKDYNYLLRKYFLEEIKTYTLFSKLKQTCNRNNTLILYFFNPEDISSEQQGKVIDVFVKKHRGISVFSVNFKYQGDILTNNIKTYYNITMTPTVIINNAKRIDHFIDLEHLETELLDHDTPTKT